MPVSLNFTRALVRCVNKASRLVVRSYTFSRILSSVTELLFQVFHDWITPKCQGQDREDVLRRLVAEASSRPVSPRNWRKTADEHRRTDIGGEKSAEDFSSPCILVPIPGWRHDQKISWHYSYHGTADGTATSAFDLVDFCMHKFKNKWT